MLQLPPINQIRAELCKRSFYEFVQYFWDTIIAEQPIWNWHIKYLCDELQQIGTKVANREQKDYDYIIINVPPGSSKSTIISEMYPLWCWTIDQTQRFICGSYASTPAEDISEKCYNIYKSDKFLQLFPELVKKSTGGKTGFTNGLLGERYTTSTGSGITGIHAHQIILDDPMSPAVSASLVERTVANKWVSETISSRKVSNDISVVIIVMQRLHELDTTGYLLSKKDLKIKHICIPAEVSKDINPPELKSYYIDGLFDPIRRNRESLNTTKTDLGSYGYAGQMMQRPAPLEGGMIKKNWFPIIERAEVPPGVVNFYLDPAYTAKQTNDPTGAQAYIAANGNLYILFSTSVWKEFPDLCAWLPEWVKQWGYSNQSRIRIEPKASGKSIVQQIKSTTGLNVIEDQAPKDDKVTRVNSASPKMEAGRVFLVRGSWNEAYLNQMASFPNGVHDDEVDCTTAAIENELNKPKFVVSVF